jgi:hypothetical protein
VLICNSEFWRLQASLFLPTRMSAARSYIPII